MVFEGRGSGFAIHRMHSMVLVCGYKEFADLECQVCIGVGVVGGKFGKALDGFRYFGILQSYG